MTAEAPKTWELDGTTYTLAAIEPDELITAIENRFRELRKPPLEAVLAQWQSIKDNPEVKKFLLDKAYEEVVATQKPYDRDAVGRWIDSHEGVSWVLWYQTVKNHPDLKLETAQRWVIRTGIAEATRIRDAANKSTLAAAQAIREARGIPPDSSAEAQIPTGKGPGGG